MKRPNVSFSKDAILDFLLAHCEKFIVALVALGGLGLAWGGVDALRSKAVKPDQTPDAIRDFTARVNRHIDAATKPPADALPPLPRLAEAIEPWRPGQVTIAPPTHTAVFDKPLFQELAKRTKPEVFPIEDLRAVAGVAVFPVADNQAGMAPAVPRPQPAVDEPPARGRGRGRRREAEPPPETMPAPPMMPGDAMPRGRIAAYVVVTGLVPVAKQQAEFERCFGSAGLQDPRLDEPRWSQYRVERAAEGTDAWKPLKLENIETFEKGGTPQNNAASPLQPEFLPPTFLLGANEAELGYVAGLPQRIDDAWGLVGVHPWFRDELLKFLAERRAGLAAAAETEATPLAAKDLKTDAGDHAGEVVLLEGMQFTGEPDPQAKANLVAQGVQTTDGDVTFQADDVGLTDEVVFVFSSQWARSLALDGGVSVDTPCSLRVRIEKVGGSPVARILGIRYGEAAAAEELVDPVPLPLATGPGFMPGGDRGEPGGGMAGSDYRLFRFVDTDVKPGDRYRYRVKFAIRNPNFGLDKQHLADPSAAKGEFLVSKESNATPAVEVPVPTAVVVRTLTKDEIKKLRRPKAGWYELLVLGEAAETGNYALRSVITEPGGAANIDPELNKPGDTRMRGEAIVTDRILLDVRGRQEEPGAGVAGKEPLEMLVLDPATGAFEFVSAADSQASIDRYRPTLPVIEDAKKPSGKKDANPAAGPANPFETGRP